MDIQNEDITERQEVENIEDKVLTKQNGNHQANNALSLYILHENKHFKFPTT